MATVNSTELDRYKALGNDVNQDIHDFFNESDKNDVKSSSPKRPSKSTKEDERIRQVFENNNSDIFLEEKSDNETPSFSDSAPYSSNGSISRSTRRSRSSRGSYSRRKRRQKTNRERIEIEAKRKYYLDQLRQWRVPVDPQSSLADLQFIYQQHKEQMDSASTVSFMSDMLKLSFTGLEYGNSYLGNYLALDGWSSYAGSDMNRYQSCLQKIYNKYFRGGSGLEINPFLQLAFLIFSSAILYHFQTKMGMSPSPTINNNQNNNINNSTSDTGFPSMNPFNMSFGNVNEPMEFDLNQPKRNPMVPLKKM